MKNTRTLKSAVAIAVLGSFLAACSGGGNETKTLATRTPTTSNNTTTTPTVTPNVSAGPVTTGFSSDAVIDDIAMTQQAQQAQLDRIEASSMSAEKNSKKAKSNSNWAKWLGVGAVGALGLMMINNGAKTYAKTGSIWQGLGGFVFNDGSGAERKVAEDLADQKLNQYQGTSAYYNEQAEGRHDAMMAAGLSANTKLAGAVGARLDKSDVKYEESTASINRAIAENDARPALKRFDDTMKNYVAQITTMNADLAQKAGKLEATEEALAAKTEEVLLADEALKAQRNETEAARTEKALTIQEAQKTRESSDQKTQEMRDNLEREKEALQAQVDSQKAEIEQHKEGVKAMLNKMIANYDPSEVGSAELKSNLLGQIDAAPLDAAEKADLYKKVANQ